MSSNPVFSIESYGIYERWDSDNKALPKIKTFTTLVPAEIDIEFGLTIKAVKAKGLNLFWCIEHPNVTDRKGRVMAPFSGDVFVRTNDWRFYLGDTVWPPIEDKTGDWYMYLKHEGSVIAEKTFEVTLENMDDVKEREFWKKRGF